MRCVRRRCAKYVPLSCYRLPFFQRLLFVFFKPRICSWFLSSFVLTTILFSPAKASFEKKGNGASNIGLSLSGIASKYPDFSVFSNPSLICGNPAIDFFYRNYFGINDLNQIALNIEFTLIDQPVGLAIMRYGNSLYSETDFSIATSYQIDPTIILGLSVSTYYLQIKSLQDGFSAGFNLSMIYMVNEKLRVAGTINNINEPGIGSAREKIPVCGVLGISYSPLQEVEILVDTFKEEFFNFAYRLGTRINIISNINILAGFKDNINSFSAGFELMQNNYTIKYSVDIHPVLNASHAIGLKYVL